MPNISYAAAKILYQGRAIFFAIAILLTGFFCYQALQIGFNFSPDTIFIENDPAFTYYQENYLPHFAHLGAPSVLAVSSRDAKKDLLPVLLEAANALQKKPEITQIISPHNQPLVIPTREGVRMLSAVDEKGELQTMARDYFTKHPLYSGSFFSEKTNAMALVFMLDLRFHDQVEIQKITENIKDEIARLKTRFHDVDFHIAGLPFIQDEMVSLLKSDQMIFMPLLGLFLVVLLLLMTKHPLGALYPVVIIFFALIWTVGYLSLIGHDINVVNNAIFILIMVIGIADAVHIYTRFVDESVKARRLANGNEPEKKIVVINTISAMLLPCFLTSATTALGFAASSAAGVTIIQQFGTDTAVGVIFCFVTTFTMMPLLLTWHKTPRGHHARWLRFWPKKFTVDAMLFALLAKSIRYAKILAVSTLVLIALSAWIARDIESNQSWVGELPKSNPMAQALSFVENNFTGVMPFYVVFSGKKEALQSFAQAKSLSEISDKLRSHSLKPTIRSPSDPINFLLAQNPQPLEINQIDEDTYNELMVMMNQPGAQDHNRAPDPFWSQDKTHVRIQGFLSNVSTSEVESFRTFLDKTIAQLKISGVDARATGPALISSRALHNITRDMAYSMGLAILYISVLMAVFFRSIRLTLIAVLPNLLPIMLTIAGMNLLGIDVRLATVMIFSMALGLSIDTCIHLLCRVQEESYRIDERFKKLSLIRSLYHAFHGSGRPILYTTVILLGGFSIMMFSHFMALRDFGVIASIVLVSAFFSDIILLPALLFLTSHLGKNTNVTR